MPWDGRQLSILSLYIQVSKLKGIKKGDATTPHKRRMLSGYRPMVLFCCDVALQPVTFDTTARMESLCKDQV